jgi:DNA-binding response OmpR family regulator
VHLLVVEDDPRLLRLLSSYLTKDHNQVESASTAAQALAIAAAPLDLDAIVLDVGLPDGSGLEVARSLRHDGCRVPILMMSGRDAVSERIAGLDAGADDYLLKPFAYPELLARLRALVRRQPAREPDPLAAGPIALDEVARSVALDGQPASRRPDPGAPAGRTQSGAARPAAPLRAALRSLRARLGSGSQ